MSDDYFRAALAAPQLPPGAPAADRPPRRLLVGGLCLALLITAGMGVARVRAAADAAVLSELRAVTTPASAAVGWAPTFVDAQGRPARWDPCQSIRYVVQTSWMPPQGRRDLVEALRRISEVSGLRFVDDGDTDEIPSEGRAAYQPERYGQRWAPLLVAWVPPAETDLGLGDGVQGVSFAAALPGTDAGGHLVTGQVALDADRRLSSGFGPGSTEGEVLLHELAHAVGLGHVDDPTQVMYTTTTNSESTFGRGDRAGLVALGAAAGCHPAPVARAET